MNRASIKEHLVEDPSHMISHYTLGHVTTLHDFGSVLRQASDTFLCSHHFMVPTLGMCVIALNNSMYAISSSKWDDF